MLLFDNLVNNLELQRDLVAKLLNLAKKNFELV